MPVEADVADSEPRGAGGDEAIRLHLHQVFDGGVHVLLRVRRQPSAAERRSARTRACGAVCVSVRAAGRPGARVKPAFDAVAGPADASVAGVQRVVLAGVNQDAYASVVGADNGDRRAVEAEHDRTAVGPRVDPGVRLWGGDCSRSGTSMREG